jgi:serine/threonine protein kinase
MDDLPGQTIGQYQIIKELGRGGMAVVYQAYQPSLNRYVALKVLPPQFTFDEQFVERFSREAQAAAGLRHPNVVVVYDIGQQGSLYYIVMEYLEGQTLKQLVEQQGPLPAARVSRIVTQIAMALDYAHKRGFVHRDVKPSNIFVGEDDHVTLTDFGIAKAASETKLTRTGMLIGTPEYMSPEQSRGEEVTRGTDIYALGVVTYEMLAGQVPFGGTTPHAVLHKQIYESVPPVRSRVPGLPAGLDAVLARALSKHPRERYASAMALADVLADAAVVGTPSVPTEAPPTVAAPLVTPEPLPVQPPPATAVPEARRRSRLPVSPWALAGLLAVAWLVIVVLATRGGGSKSVPTPSATPSRGISPTVPSRATSPATPAPASRLLGTDGGLLFTSNRTGRREVYGLTSSGEVIQLTRSPDRTESWGPVFEPDGDALFTSNRTGKQEVYRLHWEGEIVRLTYSSGGAESWEPAVEPDGDVLFTSTRDGKREVYRLRADGNSVRLTYSPGRSESWGALAEPDGDVLFTSTRDGKREVYRLRGDGESVRLTYSPGGSESWGAALEPDGDMLFTSTRDGRPEVYRLRGDGTVVRLTRSAGGSISWGAVAEPGGDVLFTSNRDGKWEIYRLDSKGDVWSVTDTPGGGESWTGVDGY